MSRTPGPETLRAKTPRPSAGLDRPGFTLVEILVVIILLTIFLGLGIPRIGGIGQGEELRKTSRGLAAHVLEAHSQAAVETRPYYLCLDLTNNVFWLDLERPRPGEEKSGEAQNQTALGKGVVFKDVLKTNNEMVTAGIVCFAFWANGGNEPGTIHLIAKDEEMTLFIRPYLGRLDIEEGYLREEKL